MDPLETRMERLGWRLNDLYNYTFADVYGIDPDAVVGRLNAALGGDYFTEVGLWTRAEPDVDLEALARCEADVARLLAAVREDSLYQEFLGAYNRNDQAALRRLASSVFDVKPDPRPKPLYHGIRAESLEDADAYLDLVLRVMAEGIRPSSHNIHWGMDEHIRPVYCVWDRADTHGLLFLGFHPSDSGLAVFIPGDKTERLIYAPVVKAPFTLHAKMPEHIGRIRAPEGLPMDVFEQADSLDEIRERSVRFSAELIRLLESRKIPYVPCGR